jgi:predicted RNA-binding protein YlxR (DUF448 family)
MFRLGLEASRLVVLGRGPGVGRGAWLHADADCARRAIATRGFARAWRREVAVPDLAALLVALGLAT